MNAANPPAFFDPRSAYRDLVARLAALNGSGHYPSADWKQALAQVDADDRREYAQRCNAQIPAHAVVLVDFRLVGPRVKLIVLAPASTW